MLFLFDYIFSVSSFFSPPLLLLHLSATFSRSWKAHVLIPIVVLRLYPSSLITNHSLTFQLVQQIGFCFITPSFPFIKHPLTFCIINIQIPNPVLKNALCQLANIVKGCLPNLPHTGQFVISILRSTASQRDLEPVQNLLLLIAQSILAFCQLHGLDV